MTTPNSSGPIEWINSNVMRYDSTTGRTIPLTLNCEQTSFLEYVENCRNTHASTCYYRYIQRRWGYTTAAVAYAICLMHNTPKQNILFMTVSYKQAIDLADLFRSMRNSLDEKYQKVPLTKDNNLECMIGTSHRIRFIWSDNVAALRGYSYDSVFLQDFDVYINKKHLMRCIYDMVATKNCQIFGYSFHKYSSIADLMHYYG